MCEVSHRLQANRISPAVIIQRRSIRWLSREAITTLNICATPTTNTVVPICRLSKPRTRARYTGTR